MTLISRKMVMNGQDVINHHEGNDKDQVAIIKKNVKKNQKHLYVVSL